MSDSSVPRIHKRIRLQSLEYTEERLYFVTLCTDWREPIFGEVVEGQMQLSRYGSIVAEEWRRSPEIRPELVLDAYVIMPDHMHALVGISEEESRAHCRAALQPEPHRGSRDRAPRSLSSFIAQFKAHSTKRINELRNTPGNKVWQPRFHDHVVRLAENPAEIRAYIRANPERWYERYQYQLGGL